MKLTAIVMVILLFFFTVTDLKANISNRVRVESSGGTSSVKINNQLGSNTNSNTSNTSTSTKVEIDQSGEGTSEVSVNGKEWKLEGPGTISVDENSGINDSAEVKAESDELENENEDDENEEDLEDNDKNDTDEKDDIDENEDNDEENKTDNSPFKFVKEFFQELRNFFSDLFK